MTQRHMAKGQIIAVQEQRFRLVTDDGRGLLLTLHNRAHTPADLLTLQQSGERVQVTYEGEPGLTSGVARRIDFISPV